MSGYISSPESQPRFYQIVRGSHFRRVPDSIRCLEHPTVKDEESSQADSTEEIKGNESKYHCAESRET